MNNLPPRAVEPQLPALPQEMSLEQVAARVEKVRALHRQLMKPDIHYGIIPGTDKPTLLKPGAELILMTFMLDPQYDLKTVQNGNHREINSTCTLYHIPTNRRVGSGVGSCSTFESKYRWRYQNKCPDCGEDSLMRSKYGDKGWYCNPKRGGCSGQFKKNDSRIKAVKIENPDLADQYNTVLKIAAKRSLVDAVLKATAASEAYTQDLEDFSENQANADSEAFERTETEARADMENKAQAATKQATTLSPTKCAACGGNLMVSKFDANELYCVKCKRKFPKAQGAKPAEEPVVVKVDKPVDIIVTNESGEGERETQAARAQEVGAAKPITRGQVNLLRKRLSDAGLIAGDDTTKAIGWLATYLGVEVVYDDTKGGSENLDALMRTIDGNQVGELKDAIGAEVKVEE